MLTRDQAEAASEAILEPKREELAKERERRRQVALRVRAQRRSIGSASGALESGNALFTSQRKDRDLWCTIEFGPLSEAGRLFPAKELEL